MIIPNFIDMHVTMNLLGNAYLPAFLRDSGADSWVER